eukprot:632362-Pelagomonas_calceolata.AAC.3
MLGLTGGCCLFSWLFVLACACPAHVHVCMKCHHLLRRTRYMQNAASSTHPPGNHTHQECSAWCVALGASHPTHDGVPHTKWCEWVLSVAAHACAKQRVQGCIEILYADNSA